MRDNKFMISTVSALAAVSFSLGSLAADAEQPDPFEAEELRAGFMTSEVSLAEGSCGEGSCGEDDDDKDKDEDKDKDKDEEGACGEGACGEGTCGAA